MNPQSLSLLQLIWIVTYLLLFWRPSEYNFYLQGGAVMPWCTLEGATYDVNYVATYTCFEALDIMSRVNFAEALEANTDNSCLRPSNLREATR